MDNIAISVKDLKKSYRYYKSTHQKLWHELFGRNTGEVIDVLDGVSFDIHEGEKVVLLGGIGSGRTSIMRILAGIYKPDGGSIWLKSKPSTIFDNRAGLSVASTGTDNYYIRAGLMGWTKEQAKALEDEVFEFAELKDIKDNLMKTYPTGSMARLGFTMSTAMKTQIILYDELFNLGGRNFVLKGIDRLKNLVEGDDVTLLMTAPSYPIVKEICTRGIVLYEGKICFDGTVDEAINYYRTNCKMSAEDEKEVRERMKAEDSEMTEEAEDYDDFG